MKALRGKYPYRHVLWFVYCFLNKCKLMALTVHRLTYLSPMLRRLSAQKWTEDSPRPIRAFSVLWSYLQEWSLLWKWPAGALYPTTQAHDTIAYTGPPRWVQRCPTKSDLSPQWWCCFLFAARRPRPRWHHRGAPDTTEQEPSGNIDPLKLTLIKKVVG